MNKKNNQYVPICFLAGLILCIAVVFFMVKPTLEEYNDAKDRSARAASDLRTYEERAQKEKQKQAEEEMNLKSIKQIYETVYDNTDNLAAFGTMFDDLIKKAQENDLFIRSIEYDTKPADNSIYTDFSEQYNVCKLNFFLVGKYPNLRNFLNDITNNFKFLLSVSNVNITAFAGDTDYILIKLSVTLYSKKPMLD